MQWWNYTHSKVNDALATCKEHWWVYREREQEKRYRTERWGEMGLGNTKSLIVDIPCLVINGRGCSLWLVFAIYHKNLHHAYHPTCWLDPAAVGHYSLQRSVTQAGTFWGSLQCSSLYTHSLVVISSRRRPLLCSNTDAIHVPLSTTPALVNVSLTSPLGYWLGPSIQIPVLK